MTLLQRLEDIFQSVLGDDAIALAPETTAADIPGWDSLAHINLMFSIEQAFGIQFIGNQFAEFRNLGELMAFLEAADRSGRLGYPST
jgi:acyl carrier protein